MSINSWLILAALVVFALPISQAIWLPLTHLRFNLYYRRRAGGPPALGLMGSLGYYWRALMANLVMGWWFLRGLGRNGLRPPGGAVTGPPVL
ncbi:MAG: hypothetical protein AAF657_39930, partial [Acidobacteriota bacterium]